MGFEPTTASLEGWNSTTELRPHNRLFQYIISKNFPRFVFTPSSRPTFNLLKMVGRQGFEPWKPMAADLQSAPVDHLGTCPL